MTEQEEQKILTYFKKHNLDIVARPEYLEDKKMLLEVAEKTMHLLGYSGDQLLAQADHVSKMFEFQLEERINKQT